MGTRDKPLWELVPLAPDLHTHTDMGWPPGDIMHIPTDGCVTAPGSSLNPMTASQLNPSQTPKVFTTLQAPQPQGGWTGGISVPGASQLQEKPLS